MTHVDLPSLRPTYLLFRAAFEHALDAFVIFDSDGRYLHLNPVARDLIGVPTGETSEHRITDLADKPADEIAEFVREFLEHGVKRGAGRISSGDLERDVDYTARAHIVPGRHMAVIRDVTDARRVEAELRQAQKMEAVGQLTGGIAHDFNNLLTVILGYSELISMSLPDSAVGTKEELQQISNAAKRGAELVQNMLAFSRKRALTVQAVQLHNVLEETVPMLRRLIPEHILVELSVDDGVPPVRADAGALQQILLNLATNARDAMPGGGRLRIELHQMTLEGYALIRVTDSGTGIDSATLQRVFEPFFTTKAQRTGSGLGLSMVYGLMQQMGGHVDITSEVGVGTTVTLYLPTLAEAW